MKSNSLIALLSFLFISFNSIGQSNTDSLEVEPLEQKKITPPTLGLGVGLISFYGDLRDYDYGNPFVSNPVYELYLHQPLLEYLNLNLYYMFGKMRVEERRLERNLNFESTIRVSGLSLEYNFGNFLNPRRSFSPFITAGVEMLEFNSKTDLISSTGSRYNYWSDGTIRNLPENSPGAEFAVEIQRDYDYETDIREVRFDGRGFYPERSVAIPLGIGGNVKITNQINFRIASTFHLTFTDMIDGVDPKSSEKRVGSDPANSNNDHFLATTISLTYNFRKIDTEADLYDEPIDFYAYDPSDYDEDGVIDFMDKCPNTPADVEVDTLGCPIDTDGDGLADFLDKEINSLGTTVNAEGVYLTDEMIYESYLKYSDTSGEFADVVSTNFTGNSALSSRFRINVGAYRVGDQPENIESLLNLPDLKTEVQDSLVVYSVGGSNDLKEVVKRKAELSEQGLSPTIEEKSNDQSYISAGERVNELKPVGNSSSINTGEAVVFRVQLGAFKTQPDKRFFKNTSNLIVLESGGLFRYYSGAYNNFKDAAEHKVKMAVNGFEGAFVTAFKDGKKVPLESVGVKAIQQSPLIGE